MRYVFCSLWIFMGYRESLRLKSSVLNTIADRTYKTNPKFRPILGNREDDFTMRRNFTVGRVHQALSIIQFKLETQLIKRRPEFQMEDQVKLDDIDYLKECVTIDGKKYNLTNTCFQTIIQPIQQN